MFTLMTLRDLDKFFYLLLITDALARLKERIKLQKEQASRLSPTDSIAGEENASYLYLAAFIASSVICF